MTTDTHPNREDVMAWLDDELDATESAAVRAHVDACPACRALAGDLRAVSAHLAAWQIAQAPESLKLVGARVAPRRHRGFWGIPTRWQLAGLAALLLVGVVASLYVTGGSNRRIEQAAAVQQGQSGRGLAARNLGYIGATSGGADPSQPLVARTASLRLIVVDVDKTRASVEQYLSAHGGSISQLSVSGERPDPRSLTAILKVPSADLAAALAALRALGRVQDESQASEDVTSQSIDLDARLANARRTEQRLAAILLDRTGKVADVLEVEREIARVRGDIERMEAERKQLTGRVVMASIAFNAGEERRAEVTVARGSAASDLRNAASDGVQSVIALGFGAVLGLLRLGPTLAVLALAIAWPARVWWRRRRTARATAR